MKYLMIPLVLLVAGCSTTVPVKMKFPDVPAEMTTACVDLDQTPADTKQLSTTLEVVVKNYSKYHECRTRVDAWIEWHRTQKQIYESVK
jgi:hypothetical protein